MILSKNFLFCEAATSRRHLASIPNYRSLTLWPLTGSCPFSPRAETVLAPSCEVGNADFLKKGNPWVT